MKLTLTRKISFGYFLMILLVVVEGTYAILELNRISRLTRSVVEGEVVSIDLEKKLIDIFLSQISSEKKYLVVRDDDFLELALTKAREFDETVVKMIAGESRSKIREELETIRERHGRHLREFISAVTERKLTEKSDKLDPSEWTTPGESEIGPITRGLETMIFQEEQEMSRKMSEAQQVSLRAYQITLVIVIAMGSFGLIMALLLTRNIQVPIHRLMVGTKYIARGHFNKRIEIASRDELGDLAKAFNSMTEKLDELERMKRDFISNVSHELRTPLTSIKEATGLLHDEVPGKINDVQKRLLGIAQEETGKMIRLINNLLDLSRIRAGMMHYHFERGDIVSVVKTGLGNIRFLAELKELTLHMDAEEGLPLVQMDGGKMEQVINNLLSNAVKFSRKGGKIVVKVFQVSRDAHDWRGLDSQKAIRLSVEDTGVGIDGEQLSDIFGRFQQGDPMVDNGQRVKGSGLGLAICKYYVEAHGGCIWAESEKDRGTRIFLDLPLAEKEKAVAV
ncbi:MAG: HAMP domain-containing sensor histidine kinase [bacterium]|nr:HAMP domain-containing sensor histidine kinase [bacterium]